MSERTRLSHRGTVEEIARAFHASYEEWAVELGWQTQERSRTVWCDLPEANRATMLATVQDLLDQGVIRPRGQR